LPADETFLGSASLDLWLASQATDTDVQVTLTEVRPDGQELYIQKGWLKASQRALDPAQSSALRPYETHQESDAAPLTPGDPALLRVEIFPFGHVVRAGSRLRVWIEAPTIVPELWSFVPNPQVTQNTVLHDAAHPSALVLPLVPNDPERVATLPACGTLIRQPCRPDALAAGGASVAPTTPAPAPTPAATATPASAAPTSGESLPRTGGGAWLAPGALFLVLYLLLRGIPRPSKEAG
jgi:hypothetical protein